MEQEYYGTVAHWFKNQKLGSIKPDDALGENILLIAEQLPDYYLLPKVGDEVRYRLGKDSNNRTVATAIEPLPPPKDGAVIRVAIKVWDTQRNGGYGIYGLRKQVPIFALGQLLADQTRIPEPGDVVQGRLKLHDNGQWMLTEISVIDRVDIPKEPLDEAASRLESERRYAGSSYGSRVHEVQEKAKQSAAEKEKKPLPNRAVKANMLFPAFTALSGRIVRWDDEKGFGFISSGSEGKEIFFHISAFHYCRLRPEVGRSVSFYCNRPIADAKQQAVRVVLQGHESALLSDEAYDQNNLHIQPAMLILYLLLGGGYLYWVFSLSWKLAAFFCLASAVAFFSYRTDKNIALKNSRNAKTGYQGRTPENRLHQIGLLGGWPGALLARAAYRHKTVKTRFVVVFWLVALLNITFTASLLWWYPNNPLSIMLTN